MPFMVGSTGSVLPAPKRVVDNLVVNENDDGAAGANALVDDATVKAKIDADRIFIVAFGCRYSVFNANIDDRRVVVRGLHSITFELLTIRILAGGNFVRRRRQHQDTHRQLQR
jgi:hypothetical protein